VINTMTNTSNNRASIVKRMLIMLVAVIVVIGAVVAWHIFIGVMTKKFMASMGNQVQTVSTVTAGNAPWQSTLQANGTLRAVRGADLSVEAAGIVDTINFDSGADVPAGAMLLRLKPNDDPAKLQQLQAAAELDAITYRRDQEQFAAQAVSQATLDTDLANLKSARAQVAAQQALIEEKTLKAPFAGRLGIRLVDQGQYLASGTAVVTLQALDPIVIDFYVPQQSLAKVKLGALVDATIDTYPGTIFKGTISSLSSKVDAASRNIQVRASFHNADHQLVPGMYANVELNSGAARQEITVPQTAITYNPYGDTIFVVAQNGNDEHGKPKMVATQRFVTLSDTRGDQVSIKDGLKVGEVVVIAGQMKLHNGSAVTIDNHMLPPNQANPTPPNS
jgi:membrane fusion protein (multidrug efflux system)